MNDRFVAVGRAQPTPDTMRAECRFGYRTESGRLQARFAVALFSFWSAYTANGARVPAVTNPCESSVAGGDPRALLESQVCATEFARIFEVSCGGVAPDVDRMCKRLARWSVAKIHGNREDRCPSGTRGPEISRGLRTFAAAANRRVGPGRSTVAMSRFHPRRPGWISARGSGTGRKRGVAAYRHGPLRRSTQRPAARPTRLDVCAVTRRLRRH